MANKQEMKQIIAPLHNDDDDEMAPDAKIAEVEQRVQEVLKKAQDQLIHACTKNAQKRRRDMKDMLSDPARGHSAFYKHLKADQYKPTTILKIGDHLTADTNKIVDAFVEQWHGVYHRLKDCPPDYQQFEDAYGRFMPTLPTGDLAPSGAQLYHKACSAKEDSAAGRDAWRPAELALLPEKAWDHRARVLQIIKRVGKWPKSYYDIISPCLRKKDKLDEEAGRAPPTILDHRLLSVYTQLYRVEMGAWCENHAAWLAKQVHRNCCGAMPGREPREASWDTQAEVAAAMDGGEEMVIAFLDYHKFFDSFEPHFFSKMLLKMGIEPAFVQLFLNLNTNGIRRIRMGGLYSKPFTTFNALGQGDPFTLIVALLFVSIQFNALDEACPMVMKSAVVDDRTIRAPKEQILRAITIIQDFDLKAGHLTNTVKLTLMATTLECRKWCEQIIIDDKKPKIANRDIVVGDVVTTSRSGNTFLATKRVNHAMSGAKRILSQDVPIAMQEKACNAVALPRLTACTLWTRPAASRLITLRNQLVTATLGRHRLMKCPEIVITFLRNAATEDPWGSLITNTVMVTRRLVDKDACRKAFFFDDLARLASRGDIVNNKKSPAPSPAYALVGAVVDAGLFLEVNYRQKKLIMKPTLGPAMDILHHSKEAVKIFLENALRHKILLGLTKELEGDQPRRKDMVGLTPIADRRATLSLCRAKKSPIKDLPLGMFRRILVSIISGSVRARDRLKAARLVQSDQCETDGQRHTTLHLWWECAKYHRIREEYQRYTERVMAVARRHGPSVTKHLEELLENNCFRHTGIAPGDAEAAAWAASRTTASNCDVQHPESEKICPTPQAIWIQEDGLRLLAIFTDGSAMCTSSEWLHHGGFGIFTAADAKTNVHAHLIGNPTTSYRSEVRAILEAVRRMGHNCCIICDNQSAANQLHKIINADEETITWRSDDECSDYWQEISTIIRAKKIVVRAKWMPSHLDEPEKSDALKRFIDAQGDARWIAANGEADKLAAKGAALAQPPKHLMERERFRLLLTRSTQRMMAHIWACHAEYINADSQDAHEIDIPEHEFGLADAWQEEWDPFELLIPENVINEGLYNEELEDVCGVCGDMDDPEVGCSLQKDETPDGEENATNNPAATQEQRLEGKKPEHTSRCRKEEIQQSQPSLP